MSTPVRNVPGTVITAFLMLTSAALAWLGVQGSSEPSFGPFQSGTDRLLHLAFTSTILTIWYMLQLWIPDLSGTKRLLKNFFILAAGLIHIVIGAIAAERHGFAGPATKLHLSVGSFHLVVYVLLSMINLFCPFKFTKPIAMRSPTAQSIAVPPPVALTSPTSYGIPPAPIDKNPAWSAQSDAPPSYTV